MRKKLVLVVVLIIIASFIFLYTPRTDHRANEPCLANPIAKGTIILLNGVSSVGKTSLQKALQESMEDPYLTFGIDKLLIGTLPERDFTGEFIDKEKPENGVRGLHGYYEP